MGSGDGDDDDREIIDCLERGLLSRRDDDDDGESVVLYRASFEEMGMGEKYVKYQTAQWVLYSILLILGWGIGLLMLLYVPVRRFVLRKELHSKKLYITPNSLVYKVTSPVPFPCFGVLKKEKHVLLPSISDIVIEQGYLQSYFGVYSIRIENVGVRRPSGDDVQIQGVANPRDFRKAVLTRVANMKSDRRISKQVTPNEEHPNLGMGYSPPTFFPQAAMSPDLPYPGELILHKIDEVGSSVKRVQSLIREQLGTTSEPH